MPVAAIASFAKKSGKSVEEVEKMWDTAKKIAKKAGREDDYAYTTGIVKKALKIESILNDLLGTSAIAILKSLEESSSKGFSLLLRELDGMTVILIDQEYIYRGDSLRQITVDANLERWRGLPYAGSGRFPMTPDQQINAWLKAKGYNVLAKNPVHKKGTEWRITLVNLSYRSEP